MSSVGLTWTTGYPVSSTLGGAFIEVTRVHGKTTEVDRTPAQQPEAGSVAIPGDRRSDAH
ncbi:hypothetical protein M1M07_29225 [Rhodococcus sp. HM1]|uniref:hypothetical protein n=1 Tax=Rhodococcus sp. HM1 TaxID=2937759 RepID=UPI00200B6DA8|nr:hypothetical protein [Rhodococcus sp. HM1]MCK8675177.1 hypothetical protein [Rhodococcus sp. HM1]